MSWVRKSKKIVGIALCGSSLFSITLKASAHSDSSTQAQQTKPALTHTLWDEISQNFKLNHEVDRGEINRQIAVLQQHQKSLYRALQAAAPYISYIFQQTKAYGVPAELALLPMVESQYNPNAKSGPGASGVWQIMPKTGTDMGLKTSNVYDGRRDIVASTHAALTYLTALNQMFKKDWQIALAAYNWGPGNVNKQMKRQSRWYRAATFWELNLPKETANYVPKLLALAEVVQHPQRYNIQLPHLTNIPYLKTIRVAANVDLNKVAANNGISPSTMQKLNPGYIKMATTQHSPNTLLIPTTQANAPVILADMQSKPTVVLPVPVYTGAKAQPMVEAADDLKRELLDSRLLPVIFHQGKWLTIGV